MTLPLKRPLMICIDRTCPVCGSSNRIMTPEIRPSWDINCSSCGAAVIERRKFRPRLVAAGRADSDELPVGA